MSLVNNVHRDLEWMRQGRNYLEVSHQTATGGGRHPESAIGSERTWIQSVIVVEVVWLCFAFGRGAVYIE